MRCLLFVAALALSACGPTDDREFYKPGVSQSQRNLDGYECERDVRSAAGSFGPRIDYTRNAMDFAIRCMASKGYQFLPMTYQ